MQTKIITVRESVKLTKRRELVPTMVVEYMVGDQGPFTYEIEKEKFSRETALREIERQADEIRAMISST